MGGTAPIVRALADQSRANRTSPSHEGTTQKLEDGSINDVAFGNGVYIAAGSRAFWVSAQGQIWEQSSINCDSATGATPPGSTFPQPAIVAIMSLA